MDSDVGGMPAFSRANLFKVWAWLGANVTSSGRNRQSRGNKLKWGFATEITGISLFIVLFFLMRLYRALRGCRCGSRGFLEDCMMDIPTGRAPPPARAESHLSKGSRELARPWPSLLENLGLRRHRCYSGSRQKTTRWFGT